MDSIYLFIVVDVPRECVHELRKGVSPDSLPGKSVIPDKPAATGEEFTIPMYIVIVHYFIFPYDR